MLAESRQGAGLDRAAHFYIQSARATRFEGETYKLRPSRVGGVNYIAFSLYSASSASLGVSSSGLIAASASVTGSLFAAAGRLGALAAGADESALQAATDFGARAGALYQIADDLADGARLGSPSPRAELGLLLDEARRALAAFPANERTQMLAEMPHALIGAQKRSRSRTR